MDKSRQTFWSICERIHFLTTGHSLLADILETASNIRNGEKEKYIFLTVKWQTIMENVGP